MRALLVAGLVLAQNSCQPKSDVGYVEIRTVPALSNVAPPSLYLDTIKVEPPMCLSSTRQGNLRLRKPERLQKQVRQRGSWPHCSC